jgi:hypothetical protein
MTACYSIRIHVPLLVQLSLPVPSFLFIYFCPVYLNILSHFSCPYAINVQIPAISNTVPSAVHDSVLSMSLCLSLSCYVWNVSHSFLLPNCHLSSTFHMLSFCLSPVRLCSTLSFSRLLSSKNIMKPYRKEGGISSSYKVFQMLRIIIHV